MPPKNLGKLPRDLTTTFPLSPGFNRAKHTQERKMPTRAAARNKGTGYYNENKLAAAAYKDQVADADTRKKGKSVSKKIQKTYAERRESWQNQTGVMQGRVVKSKAKPRAKGAAEAETKAKAKTSATAKPKAKVVKKTPATATKTKEKSKAAGKGVKVTKASSSSSSQSKSKSPTKKTTSPGPATIKADTATPRPPRKSLSRLPKGRGRPSKV